MLSIIVAMDRTRLIGANNRLPWHFPADLKHFKSITWGKSIIMGRKTFESIGKVLPGRRNIIISRNQNLQIPEATVVPSLEAALALTKNEPEVLIIGGSHVFAESLALADRIYLTMIDHEFTGDSYFPDWNLNEWQEIAAESHEPDDKNPYPYRFLTLERKHD